MTINWAHIDDAGRIVTWGSAFGSDVFAQPLAAGLTAIARPEHVTGFEPWRYISGQWTLENEKENSV